MRNEGDRSVKYAFKVFLSCFLDAHWCIFHSNHLFFFFLWRLPADGRLAVRRPLGGAERLAHLSLRQAQGQPADLECFGEFPDLLQVDPVHLAGGGLRICNTNTRFISPLPPRRSLYFSG